MLLSQLYTVKWEEDHKPWLEKQSVLTLLKQKSSMCSRHSGKQEFNFGHMRALRSRFESLTFRKPLSHEFSQFSRVEQQAVIWRRQISRVALTVQSENKFMYLIRKEAVVAWYEVISQHLSGWTEGKPARTSVITFCCRYRESNKASPEYNLYALRLEPRRVAADIINWNYSNVRFVGMDLRNACHFGVCYSVTNSDKYQPSQRVYQPICLFCNPTLQSKHRLLELSISPLK
jgi:hypothetical protein